MLKRGSEFLLGAFCYLGIAGGLCAISFLGEFAVPVRVEAAPRWPLMHASVVEAIPPAPEAAMEE